MDKSESRIGAKRKVSLTSQQTLIHEEEGANPDSVKEIWVDSEVEEAVVDYGIKYPPSKQVAQRWQPPKTSGVPSSRARHIWGKEQ